MVQVLVSQTSGQAYTVQALHVARHGLPKGGVPRRRAQLFAVVPGLRRVGIKASKAALERLSTCQGEWLLPSCFNSSALVRSHEVERRCPDAVFRKTSRNIRPSVSLE